MGLILDSSALVAVERLGKNPRQMLVDISDKVGDTDVAISVVTLIELAHGAARADTPERKSKAAAVHPGVADCFAHPVTASVALRTGQIDGENQARGTRIPLSDLLIGVTALELGYSVATINVRHFRLVPGLLMVQL